MSYLKTEIFFTPTLDDTLVNERPLNKHRWTWEFSNSNGDNPVLGKEYNLYSCLFGKSLIHPYCFHSKRNWGTSASHFATYLLLANWPSSSWRQRTSRKWMWAAYLVRLWSLLWFLFKFCFITDTKCIAHMLELPPRRRSLPLVLWRLDVVSEFIPTGTQEATPKSLELALKMKSVFLLHSQSISCQFSNTESWEVLPLF